LYLLGWNKQTFQVHPEVLEKDIEFRKGSKVAREAFEKISPNELASMHKNFIRAVGGRLTDKKQKTKYRI
ncbi:MAG TPA: hypothetical protein VJA18_03580, partial [Candidatus Nanoarchaeia archaeon]|nr:hypothetical protein [Candidatus Nanoarchaeia archaeon]